MIVALLTVALSLSRTEDSAPKWNDAPPPWGTGESAAEDLEIGLVIFGPGRDVTGWFGHSALVVNDRKLKKSRLYNYGEFSFDQLMLARYALGRLEFWVGERAVERTYNIYRQEGRTIKTLALALAPAERLAVARFLADNVLPENKHYLYDHFTDNCATKPRDVLDRALGGRLRATARPGRMTLREHVLRHTSVFMPLAWVIDFLLNEQVDRPISTWEETFLPAELEQQVRALGLVKSETVQHAEGPVPRAAPPVLWPWLLAIGVVLATISLALRRRARALAAWSTVLAVVLGIPGAALFVLWGFTDHVITYGNENILLSNPLTLLAAPLAFAAAPGRQRALRLVTAVWTVLAGAVVVALVIQLLPWFTQVNGAHLALFVPAVLGTAIAWRLARLALPSLLVTTVTAASAGSAAEASAAATPTELR